MNPTISVIVPAYNAEKWLSRSLDSLLAQTFEDFEVILIDDGSSDSTGRLSDEYARRDNRIRVIHQPNCGVSATRQKGLELAKGEYITFLDADDYAHPEAYHTLYDCAIKNNAALVCSNYFRIEPSGIRAVNIAKSHYSVSSYLEELIFRQNGFLMRHLISRDLLSKTGAHFPSDLNFGEDLYFLVLILAHCKNSGESIRIASCKEHLFYYDKTSNPGSLTSLTPQKRFWARFRWWETVYHQIKLKDVDAGPFYARLVNDSFAVLWNDTIPRDELCHALQPYESSIKKYAPLSPHKYLTLLLCKGEYEKARKMKYLGAPRIIQDKLQQALPFLH